jgi:hypothetical protein
MQLTPSHIIIPSEELDEKLENQIKRITKKKGGIISETAFILAVTFLNYDYLTIIKVFLIENFVNFSITTNTNTKEIQSCSAIKVKDNTASLRNLNYVRIKKPTV